VPGSCRRAPRHTRHTVWRDGLNPTQLLSNKRHTQLLRLAAAARHQATPTLEFADSAAESGSWVINGAPDSAAVGAAQSPGYEPACDLNDTISCSKLATSGSSRLWRGIQVRLPCSAPAALYANPWVHTSAAAPIKEPYSTQTRRWTAGAPRSLPVTCGLTVSDLGAELAVGDRVLHCSDRAGLVF